MTMPRRKSDKVRPRFSFIDPEIGPVERKSKKARSSAGRSHAAFWSGPWRRSKSIAKPLEPVAQESVSSRTDHKLHSGDVSDKSYEQKQLIQRIQEQAELLTHPTLDGKLRTLHTATYCFSPLSYSPNAIIPTSSLLQAASQESSSLSGDFGEILGDTFSTPCKKDHHIVVAGRMLLSVAHGMAIAGQGRRAILFDLKARVLQAITKEKKSDLALVGSIMLLGSPLVCLMSQDFPDNLSLEQYVSISEQSARLCGSRAAAIAKSATAERKLHWLHLKQLSSEIQNEGLSINQLRFLDYMSRYIRMYVYSESKLLLAPKADGDKVRCFSRQTTDMIQVSIVTTK